MYTCGSSEIIRRAAFSLPAGELWNMDTDSSKGGSIRVIWNHVLERAVLYFVYEAQNEWIYEEPGLGHLWVVRNHFCRILNNGNWIDSETSSDTTLVKAIIAIRRQVGDGDAGDITRNGSGNVNQWKGVGFPGSSHDRCQKSGLDVVRLFCAYVPPPHHLTALHELRDC